MNAEERPLADPSREEIAAKLMAEGMPADEWAARKADAVGSWSFDAEAKAMLDAGL